MSGTIDLGSGTLTVANTRTLTMQTANDHGLVNVELRNHGTVSGPAAASCFSPETTLS